MFEEDDSNYSVSKASSYRQQSESFKSGYSRLSSDENELLYSQNYLENGLVKTSSNKRSTKFTLFGFAKSNEDDEDETVGLAKKVSSLAITCELKSLALNDHLKSDGQIIDQTYKKVK